MSTIARILISSAVIVLAALTFALLSHAPRGPAKSGPRFGVNTSPSPACLVQDASGPFLPVIPNGVNVLGGDVITVKLASYAGVRSWGLTVFGLDELTNGTPPALTYSVGPPGTYSFTYPAAMGRAVLLQSVVNGGVDVNGVRQSSYTTTIGVFSLTSLGERVLAMGETFETCPVGWVCDINSIIRNATGGIASIYGGLHQGLGGFILDGGGPPVEVPFSTADLAAKNVDAGSNSLFVTVPGDLVVLSTLSFTDSTASQLQLQLYKNDAGIGGSLRQVNASGINPDAGYQSFATDALVRTDGGDSYSLWVSSNNTTTFLYEGSILVMNAGTSQGVPGPPGPSSIGGGACGAPQSGAISLPLVSACIAVDLTTADATVDVSTVSPYDGLAYQFDLQAGQKSILFSGGTFVSVANGSTTPLTTLAIQGGGQSVVVKYNSANSWWTTP